MIIDSHSHWLPAEIIENSHFFSKAWGDIEAQIKMMENSGIDKAVLTYPTSDAHLKLGSISEVVYLYNDHVGQIIKRFPSKFIGAAIMPVDNEQDMCSELTRTTEELGFKAISLASSYNGRYLDDKIFLPLYKRAQEKHIPIFVHSQIINPIGSHVVNDPLLTPVIEYIFDTTMCIGKLLMADIFREFPGVKFIFAYFAGAICHLAARFDATYEMLRAMNFVKDLQGRPGEFLKNIYVDTSGDTTATNFQAALALVGPGHIVWGSDWPAKKQSEAGLEAVRKLHIPDPDKDKILGGNLQEVLRLQA